MKEQEIKELAYNCADELYAKFGDIESGPLMAEEFENVIRIILKHCFMVKKDILMGKYAELIAMHESARNGEQSYEAGSKIALMQYLFPDIDKQFRQ